MLVVDASVCAAWFLEEVGSRRARQLLAGGPMRMEVPAIGPAEVANVFWQRERRGEITAAEADLWWRMLAAMAIAVDDTAASLDGVQRCWELAREHGLTVYDAQYLELALRLGAPLATLDRALARAGRRAGVKLAL